MTAPDPKSESGLSTSAPTPRNDRVPVAFEVHELLSHLLRRAHFAAEAEFPAAYDGIEVTSRQLALLFTINRKPGSSQTELAEAVGFDANTFSDLAKRSERKGLLQRIRSRDDRRAFGLYLTDDGRAMVARAAALTPAYQARLSRNLAPDEARQLVALLHKMLGLKT
ncbi:MarR family winged helix-turn-helix transcriptional regulator [Nioella sp.]|uniref:MarR family winged helix-turn-helix transcriptional regulator n=1 Tax=Nioella sp. TaxID=1912091 RepID=UPI003516438B